MAYTKETLPKGMMSIINYGANVDANFGAYLKEMSGYEKFTTFASDLAIAECCEEREQGAIRDTYNRAKNEWLSNVKYFTELVMALNIACWRWYEWEGETSEYGKLYSDLYYEARDLAMNTYEGEDARYFFDTTD